MAESWQNMNYTRGALYFAMQPFWHTGLRGSYQVSDSLGLTALVVNGTKLYSTKGIGNGTQIPDENPGGHYQALQGVFFPTDQTSWGPPYTAFGGNPVTRAGPSGNSFTVGGAENCE